MSPAAQRRVPPQDVQVEQAILGCCLLSEDAVGIAMESLTAEMFYKSGHAEIFRAMVDLFGVSEPVDLITVTGKLSDTGKLDGAGGAAYLAELVNMIPTVSMMLGYCRRLRDKYVLRNLIAHCSEVIERCYSGASAEDVVDHAESGLFDMLAEHTSGIRKIDVLVDETVELVEKRCAADGIVTGLPTGFVDLDRMLAGLHVGNLLLLAARPSMGKTALAMNIVKGVALDHGTPVLVFSMEMSGQELAERMLAGCSLVNGQAMRTGVVTDADWPRITEAAGRLKTAPIFIDSGSALSVVDVRARARRMRSRFGVGLIVIDYLQLMRGVTRGGREQEIAEISRGLKALAKELDIPVIALSQLNRSLESRTDKRPMMSDLRESGSLEQDADVIMFIYRDEFYNPGRDNQGLAELIVGKQRSGPVGKVDLVFRKNISTFFNAR